MPNSDSALTEATAVELAARVQRGELTPVSVVEAFLNRIERLEPTIHAFQVVRREHALEEARALQQRAELASLPLAGVPVAVKDNLDVAGEPTRFGSAATSDARATQDDALVRRLRAAGAVIVGKTQMPELAIWPFTEPVAFGPTRNPWNREHTPGGSSGGSAAAVASRMVPLAVGSDGGGSIRIPAACCGVFGIKPGPGVVPLSGGAREHWCGLSEFGPIARTVGDLARLLDVLAGRAVSPSLSGPSALRIAVSTATPAVGTRVSREVKDAVARVAAALARQGHTVEHASPPYPTSIAWRFTRRWLSGIAADAEALVKEPSKLESRTRSLVRLGDWARRHGGGASASEDPYGARMAEWFSERDVLVMPTLSAPAVPVGKWGGAGAVRTMLGVTGWILTPPWNLARLPAMSIPAGLSRDGLPIGVQLVGPPGSESRLIGLAAQLEAQLAPAMWHESP